METQAIHRGHRSLVGILARIVPGNQPQCRGVIGIQCCMIPAAESINGSGRALP